MYISQEYAILWCFCGPLLFVDSFIAEESAIAGQHFALTDNPTWIIDPVDGTTNFVHK